MAPGRRSRLLVASVAVGAVILDALAKSWAVAALAGREVSVLGDLLVFRLARNPGGAFGSFQGAGTVLAVVAVLAVGWVLWYAGRVRETPLLVGLGLVAGGALGNLVDRVFRSPGFLRGYVVDFIDVPRWPTFNVADMCVSAGVILVVICVWRDDTARRASERCEQADGAASGAGGSRGGREGHPESSR